MQITKKLEITLSNLELKDVVAAGLQFMGKIKREEYDNYALVVMPDSTVVITFNKNF